MKYFFQSITTRIALSMIFIAILPLLVIAYSLQYQKKEEVSAQHLSHLQVIFKQTISTINTNVQYQKQLLVNIASMPKIAEKLKDRHPNQKLHLDPSIQAYVTNVIYKYGYYDFFIITNTGEVVYTFKKESDYGKNVNCSLLKNTGLAYVYDQASSLLDTSISPLEYYLPSKRKASFIATPIIVNHKILGVVAAQLNETYIFDLIKNYNGLGQSGEVVAGALMKDGRILAAIPLKYDPDAFKNERVLNQVHYATGMIQAVKGHAGKGEVIDYRGVKCLAVWGYEPTLKWGIVVKTDESEVFSGILKDQQNLYLILFFVALAVIAAIIVTVKSITGSINKLILSIRRFRTEGEFDLDQIDCSGEICYLSEEFNAMAKEIDSYNRDLEIKILERTQELEIAKQALETLAITNQLTGLYNRRHLDTALETNAELFERYHTQFSVCIIDIDYFKSINDTYGHQIGDHVLQSIAEIFKQQCRSIDIIGRWGGEEFLIIFPNTDKKESAAAAEKLRIAIETYPYTFIEKLTASFGVSEYRTGVQELLKNADDALYQAKEKGRNRVCVL